MALSEERLVVGTVSTISLNQQPMRSVDQHIWKRELLNCKTDFGEYLETPCLQSIHIWVLCMFTMHGRITDTFPAVKFSLSTMAASTCSNTQNRNFGSKAIVFNIQSSSELLKAGFYFKVIKDLFTLLFSSYVLTKIVL